MKKISVIILLSVIFLCGCGGSKTVYEISEASEAISDEPGISDESSVSDESSSGKSEDDSDEVSREDDIPSVIYVYICGAVKNPGVYQLSEGSRLFQAVDAAGGLLENADERSVNQAQILADGQEIIVYEKGEEVPANDTASSEPSGSGKININTAGKEDLMELPGIGESRADEIINYRNEHGGFESIEDIMNISGIKEKMFEKIKDYIEV